MQARFIYNKSHETSSRAEQLMQPFRDGRLDPSDVLVRKGYTVADDRMLLKLMMDKPEAFSKGRFVVSFDLGFVFGTGKHMYFVFDQKRGNSANTGLKTVLDALGVTSDPAVDADSLSKLFLIISSMLESKTPGSIRQEYGGLSKKGSGASGFGHGKVSRSEQLSSVNKLFAQNDKNVMELFDRFTIIRDVAKGKEFLRLQRALSKTLFKQKHGMLRLEPNQNPSEIIKYTSISHIRAKTIYLARFLKVPEHSAWYLFYQSGRETELASELLRMVVELNPPLEKIQWDGVYANLHALLKFTPS